MRKILSLFVFITLFGISGKASAALVGCPLGPFNRAFNYVSCFRSLISQTPQTSNAIPLDNILKNYVATKRGHKYYYIPNCAKVISNIKEKNRIYLTAQEVKDGGYSPSSSC